MSLKPLCLVLALTFLLPVISLAAEQPYIGIWHFDEGKGSITNNSVTKQPSGAFNSGVAWEKGVFGSAIKNGGSPGVVTEIEKAAETETIEVWAYIKQFPNQGTLYLIANDYSGRQIGIRSSGYVDYQVYNGSWGVAVSKNKLETGKWYYIAGVYNGTHNCLWIDGVEEGCAEKSGKIITEGKLEFFLYGTGADIVIDEARISEGVRSSDYFKRVYSEGVSGKKGSEWDYPPPEEIVTLPGKEILLGKFYQCDGCSKYLQGVARSEIDRYYHWNSYYNYYWVLIEPDGKETTIADYKVIGRERSRDVVSAITDVEYYVYRFLDIQPTNVTFYKNGNYKVELRKIYLNRPTLEHNTVDLSSRIDLWALEGGWWPDPNKRDTNSNYLTFGCCGYEGMVREYLSQSNIPAASLAETLEVHEIEINSIEEPAEPVANPFSFEGGDGEKGEDSNGNAPLAVAGIAGAMLVSTVLLASGTRIRRWLTPAGQQAEADRKRAYTQIEQEKIDYENWQRENANRKAAQERELRESRIKAFQEELSSLPKGTAAERGSSYYTLAQKYSDVLGKEGKKALMEASSAAWAQHMKKYPAINTVSKPTVAQPYKEPTEIREPTPIKTETSKSTPLDSITSGLGWLAGKASGAVGWVAEKATAAGSFVLDSVSKVPIVGKTISSTVKTAGEFAYGFGKSIYNTVKGLAYDLPKAVYNWATTTTDPVGDIVNGAKYVAKGAAWAAAHMDGVASNIPYKYFSAPESRQKPLPYTFGWNPKTWEMKKPEDLPKPEKSIVDIGFGAAKSGIKGGLYWLSNVPVIGEPASSVIGNSLRGARDFVVEKSEKIKRSADAMVLIGGGMIAVGGILTFTGVGAVVGAPLMSAGFGLGAASSGMDIAVYGAKGSIRKADEDDRLRAMVAPLGFIGAGVGGKGVKEFLKGTKVLSKQLGKESLQVNVLKDYKKYAQFLFEKKGSFVSFHDMAGEPLRLMYAGRKFLKGAYARTLSCGKIYIDTRLPKGVEIPALLHEIIHYSIVKGDKFLKQLIVNEGVYLKSGKESLKKSIESARVGGFSKFNNLVQDIFVDKVGMKIDPKGTTKMLEHRIITELKHGGISNPAYMGQLYYMAEILLKNKKLAGQVSKLIGAQPEWAKRDVWKFYNEFVKIGKLVDVSTLAKSAVALAKTTINLGGVFTIKHELAKLVLANEEGKKRYEDVMRELYDAPISGVQNGISDVWNGMWGVGGVHKTEQKGRNDLYRESGKARHENLK